MVRHILLTKLSGSHFLQSAELEEHFNSQIAKPRLDIIRGCVSVKLEHDIIHEEGEERLP